MNFGLTASLLLVAIAPVAHAQYAFTIIADSDAAYSTFTHFSLNDLGQVAFAAGLDAGGAGIFLTTDGSTVPVVDTVGQFSGFGRTSLSLNDRGQVAFLATLDAGGSGIYLATGPSVTPLATTAGQFSELDSTDNILI